MPDVYNSKIAKLIGKINRAKHGWAITISSTCTLYSTASWDVAPRWKRHENCHKDQIAVEGWLVFMVKYLYYNLTKGYENNPYEIAARTAEARNG